MIIKFVVEVEGEDFPFTLNTDRLPGSIGNKYLCLKELEICDDENESAVEVDAYEEVARKDFERSIYKECDKEDMEDSRTT